MEIIEWKPEESLEIVPASVVFKDYIVYRGAANEIAAYIRTLFLTEDNLKEVKQTLADARRVVTALDKERINVKKLILTEYTSFEAQIKELTKIIDTADAELRSKVKELEESERAKRKVELKELWDKRVSLYTFPTVIHDAFEKWLSPKMLNKSTTVKAAERDMTDWMEEQEKNIEAMLKLGEEYLTEYLIVMDVPKAIDRVNARKKIVEDVKVLSEESDEVEVTALFKVSGEREIQMVELLLTNNKIKYERM